MFPERIDGKEVVVRGSTTWIRWYCNGRYPEGLKPEELLGAKDPEAITMAWAELPDYQMLMAVRVPDQDARQTIQNMQESENATTSPPPDYAWKQIGGKDVFVVLRDEPFAYFYPIGNVVFFVYPGGDVPVAKILEALP